MAPFAGGPSKNRPLRSPESLSTTSVGMESAAYSPSNPTTRRDIHLRSSTHEIPGGTAADNSAQRVEAFRVLAEAVAELEQSGRRTYAAGLKPKLARRLLDGFDETILGYDSFRQFLEDAERHGTVRLVPGPNDLEVSSFQVVHTGPVTALPLPPSERRKGPPLRQDIWDAFVDWRPGVRRVLDKTRVAAVMFPDEPSPLEKP